MKELLEALGLGGSEVRLAISGERGLTLIVAARGAREPHAVVRLHRGDGPNRVAREHEVLSAIHAQAAPTFAITVPRPLARIAWGPGEAIAVGFLRGEPLRAQRSVERFRAQLGALRVWLVDLWALRPPTTLGETYALGAALDALDVEVGRIGPRVAPAWRRVREVAERLDAAAPVICHFDLAPGNVLVSRAGVGVIDWEYARAGRPLYDWFRVAVQLALARAGSVPDLSRPLERDELLLGPIRDLFFRRSELARVARSETWSALALAGLDLELADGALRGHLLQYLMLQIPWHDRAQVLERLLLEPSIFDEDSR